MKTRYDIGQYLISGPTTKRPVRPMSAPLTGTRTRSQSSPDVWNDVSICLINNRNVKDKINYATLYKCYGQTSAIYLLSIKE